VWNSLELVLWRSFQCYLVVLELATKFDALCEQFEISASSSQLKSVSFQNTSRCLNQYIGSGLDLLRGLLLASDRLPDTNATCYVLMIIELGELLLQDDSNGANYIANAKWASGLCTEDCRHKDLLWWRDGRWKRTIGPSCSSKVQTELGRPSREITKDYNAKRNVPSLTKRVDGDGGFYTKQVRLLVPQRWQCHHSSRRLWFFLNTCSQETAEPECRCMIMLSSHSR